MTFEQAIIEQLCEHPLCAFCAAERGEVVLAIRVLPVERENRVWLGPLMSLCQACHDYVMREEIFPYRCHVGLDGLPLDRRHPFNAGWSGRPARVARPSMDGDLG